MDAVVGILFEHTIDEQHLDALRVIVADRGCERFGTVELLPRDAALRLAPANVVEHVP